MNYSFLASSYDALTWDVDYVRACDYLESFFSQARCPVKTVVDLGCGTATLTWMLAERGYDTIGVDLSQEMLAQARNKGDENFGGTPPLFLCQSMDRLDLYGTMDVCVSSLDSVNYVTRVTELRRAFRRVHTFLVPGGLFLFDVRTPEALAAMDGQVFMDETDNTYCVWQGEYFPRRKVCAYYMDIFRRRSEGGWERGVEEHEERAYELEELRAMLTQAGFTAVKTYAWGTRRAPRTGDDRVLFLARKKGTSRG